MYWGRTLMMVKHCIGIDHHNLQLTCGVMHFLLMSAEKAVVEKPHIRGVSRISTNIEDGELCSIRFG